MGINKEINIKTVIFVITFIFLLASISAFSVSSPYMENKQLKVQPGETRNLEFVLQNSGATEETSVRLRIIEGSGIAELTDPGVDADLGKIYVIPIDKKLNINVKITIPENVAIGDSYHIRLGISTAAPTKKGEFGFGMEIENSFDVVVGEIVQTSPAETPPTDTIKTNWILYLSIAIILVMIIAIIFFIKRKKKKRY